MWLVGRAIAAAKKTLERRSEAAAGAAGEYAVQPRTQGTDDGRFACPIRPQKNNVEAVGPPYALRTIDQPAIFVADETSRTSQDRSPAKFVAKAGEVLPHLMPIIRLGGSDNQFRIAGPPEARHLLPTVGGVLPAVSAEIARTWFDMLVTRTSASPP